MKSGARAASEKDGDQLTMMLDTQARHMLPVIELQLRKQVGRMAGSSTRPFHEMLRYHMGWVAGGKGGKRIRPLLTMLVCASVGGNWRKAAPAAAAVELVHNFSLVHDDIQDNSPTRRGRATLWRRVGMPLAINAGDALFTMAALSILDLSGAYEPKIVAEAAAVLQQACLDLTRGQFLDLHSQSKGRLTLPGYWQMIEGKTAALLAASSHIGALLGGANPRLRAAFHRFGKLLGMAFQVEDDIIGIWGSPHETGKSASSDLAEGKLSLPVIHGLHQHGQFSRLWRNAHARSADPSELRRLLEAEGGRQFAERQAKRLTSQAMALLQELRPRGEAGEALKELALQLVSRQA